jgi:Zn-dependent protease with chaperone function
MLPRPSRAGAFSHRPAGYSSWFTWLIAGVVRDWKANLIALVAGWFGVPVALLYSIFLAVIGAIVGLFAGTLGAREVAEDTPVGGEVLSGFSLQIGGGLGFLAGIALGLVAGTLIVLVLPWLAQFANDPVVAVIVVIIHVMMALTISLLYVILGVALEPFRLRLAGARRLSRREADYLLPILHQCARELGLPNVPRLMVDDGRETNALAYTRHIVIYRGLLNEFNYDRDVVAGILSHELVHWHNADGVARLTLRGLAFPIYVAYAIVTWLLRVTDNAFIRFLALLVSWPVLATVRFLVIPVQAAGARDAEYRADQGAVLAGHLASLRRALERFQRSFDSSRNGWDRAICASHPPTELRLERLERAGDDYPLPPRAGTGQRPPIPPPSPATPIVEGYARHAASPA